MHKQCGSIALNTCKLKRRFDRKAKRLGDENSPMTEYVQEESTFQEMKTAYRYVAVMFS